MPLHLWLCCAFGPAGFDTAGVGRAAKSAFQPPWPLVVPLEPPNLAWGRARAHLSLWISSMAKPITAAVGAGSRACHGLEQLQLLALLSLCSLSLIRY